MPDASAAPSPQTGGPTLARRLGPIDATLVVMGGIIGSGIFMNPALVAREVHTPALILGAWLVGGVIAVLGAFVWAELASRRPQVGGQYAYLREAYHPVLGFVYGWGFLLVTLSGGMAAVAVTFARYARELGIGMGEAWTATGALVVLTVINCFGVRAGAASQNLFMVLKLVAIAGLVVGGALFAPAQSVGPAPVLDQPVSFGLVTAFGAAMGPVLFAYGGWQTASFLAGEVRDPRRNLPRGLLIGVGGVIVLYLAVSWVCLRVLGPAGLAATSTPASDVMRAAFGPVGGKLIAAGIAISTLGFLSQSMLTAPRLYYAMAADGAFFQSVAYVDPRTRVPVVAIVLQGAVAIAVAWSGSYEQILSFAVTSDWLLFALSASCLLVLRRIDRQRGEDVAVFKSPGHPATTIAFVAVALAVVANLIYRHPVNSLVGILIMLAGVPAWWLWTRANRRRAARGAALATPEPRGH
ncbi:MAG TPA: amino acid permease [Thermoanaerobaculia bacterium]|nr:amino acid permease [Thermoanaerobaculia bacterium]